MRKAYNDNGLIVIDDKFIGVSLGYDFCAEHEWGIDGLIRIFGIPQGSKKNMGVVGRTITKCGQLIFREGEIEKVKHAILLTGIFYNTPEENEKYMPSVFADYVKDIRSDIIWHNKQNQKILKNNKKIKSESKLVPFDEKDPIITAWSENDFGVAVYGNKETEYLKELYEAFQNNNVTITHAKLQPKNPFANSTLCLLITDRIPKEATDQMYEEDKEYYDRIDYEEEIGMKKILEKYGNKNGFQGAKYFCACAPKWIDYNDAEAREKEKAKKNTKYDIIYWVNYSDDDNNYGWYTVEEIREWMTTNKKLTEIRKAH